MRDRSAILRLRLLAIALPALWLAPAAPARASWSDAPAPVVLAADSVSSVAVCRDAQYGALVAWQEGVTAAGVLRVKHLLAAGDVDPAWPAAGAMACSVSVKRPQIGLIADSQGGAYVWWLEGSDPLAIFVRRIQADGTADPHWPARGKFMGSLPGGWRPSVLEDGIGGIFLAWATIPAFDGTLDVNTVLVSRLGPNGGNQTGWLSQNRVITLPYALHFPPSLARAPGGGVYCAFATWSEDSLSLDHGFYLVRLASNGTFAPGFAADGTRIAAFVPQLLTRADLQLTHTAPDTSGGLYVSMLQPDDPLAEGAPPSLTLVLQRHTPTGALAPGWAESGLTLGSYPQDAAITDIARASQVVQDGAGQAFVAAPLLATDSPPIVQVRRVGPAPVVSGTDLFGYLGSFQLAADPTSGADVASSWPCWQLFAFGQDAPPAVILRSQTPADGTPRGVWLFGPDVPYACRYGAAAITPTNDGSAIGVFVQMGDTAGVFAFRINGGGQVLGVPRVTVFGDARIRFTRFESASGLRVHFSLASGGAARLEAFDAMGRRLASRVVTAAAGDAETTFGEAREWASGVYLLRLSRGGAAATARALVIR